MTRSHKHILVIGGAGYIGSACVDRLVREGYSVTVFDNLRTGQRDKVHPAATFIEGSILDIAALKVLFEGRKIDAVIHLAALKAVGESETHPADYFATNVTGTINVLTAMAAHTVPHIVFSSTAAVYSPSTGSVLGEEAALGSISVYGTSKIMAETVICEFARTKGISSYALLRYFNVAGDVGLHFKEAKPQNVFPLLARAVTTGSEFSIFGSDYETRDGTCVRDYIHLADLVDAHVRALEVTDSLICNLGTEAGVSILELVREFEKQSSQQLNAVHAARRQGDPAIVIADAARARAKLGWQPRYGLSEMVRSTLSVYGS